MAEDKKNICEGLISMRECEIVINEMTSNKAPGEDGIPIEFYNIFWKQLGSVLVGMYNDSFEKNEMPVSMRKSMITLIHKKYNKSDIYNYRPISLTNTDYRIFTCVLSNRLQAVLIDIVGPYQVAYIKGRFIGTNVRMVQDIFDLYNEKNYSGLMLFADFKKALDSFEWNFLLSILQKFNFGEDFQKWVKLLYSKPCAFIKHNGFISDTYSIFRGVRQGCSLSSLMFILCMEVLSQHINQNKKSRG